MDSIVEPLPPPTEYSRGQRWLLTNIRCLEGTLIATASGIVINSVFFGKFPSSHAAEQIFNINLFTTMVLVLLLPRSVIRAAENRSTQRTATILCTASFLITTTFCVLAEL